MFQFGYLDVNDSNEHALSVTRKVVKKVLEHYQLSLQKPRNELMLQLWFVNVFISNRLLTHKYV